MGGGGGAQTDALVRPIPKSSLFQRGTIRRRRGQVICYVVEGGSVWEGVGGTASITKWGRRG